MLEGSIRHALFDSDRRRPADHDGATRPLRSIVLLLPPWQRQRRTSSDWCGSSASRQYLLRQSLLRRDEKKSSRRLSPNPNGPWYHRVFQQPQAISLIEVRALADRGQWAKWRYFNNQRV